jgi:acetyltransferase-like isoleucine patch superfamily enzyme
MNKFPTYPDSEQPEETDPESNPVHRTRFPWLNQGFKKAVLGGYWPIKSYWEDWQDYSAELVGCIPSHAFRLGWYRTICRMKIGKFSNIHRRCRMYKPKQIEIGEHTVINYGVLLDGRRGLWIGNNVSISEGTVILTLGHNTDDPEFGLKGAAVRIEDYVFIGSCARILPGVRLGKGCVVAAGAVVTKNVEAFTVVGGIPATFIRRRNEELRYQLDYKKRFG